MTSEVGAPGGTAVDAALPPQALPTRDDLRAALRDGVRATLARHERRRNREQEGRSEQAVDVDRARSEAVQSAASAAVPQAPVEAVPETPAASVVRPSARPPASEVVEPAPPATSAAPAEELPAGEETAPVAPPPSVPAQAEVPAAVPEREPADHLRDPAWQERFRFDPGLRRVVRGILGDPNLSEADRAIRIAERVQRTDQRMGEARVQRQEEERLLEEDPLSYVDRVRAYRARNAASVQQARLAAEAVARFLDLDPTDQEFQEAGQRPDESYEAGVERFQALVRAKSPVVQAAVNEALAKVRAEYETRAQTAEAARKQAIQAAEREWQAKLEAAVEEAKAQARGGVAPPRPGVPLPSGATPGPAKLPTISEIRGLLGAGIRARQEAQ